MLPQATAWGRHVAMVATNRQFSHRKNEDVATPSGYCRWREQLIIMLHENATRSTHFIVLYSLYLKFSNFA
jgi:hypothetical protein